MKFPLLSAKKRSTTIPETEEILTQIRLFVTERSQLLAAEEIGPDLELFSGGVLDSLAFVELVVRLEDHFSVRLSSVGDVGVGTAGTPALIAGLVQRAARG